MNTTKQMIDEIGRLIDEYGFQAVEKAYIFNAWSHKFDYKFDASADEILDCYTNNDTIVDLQEDALRVAFKECGVAFDD